MDLKSIKRKIKINFKRKLYWFSTNISLEIIDAFKK
jgi:hypothetical protein